MRKLNQYQYLNIIIGLIFFFCLNRFYFVWCNPVHANKLIWIFSSHNAKPIRSHYIDSIYLICHAHWPYPGYILNNLKFMWSPNMRWHSLLLLLFCFLPSAKEFPHSCCFLTPPSDPNDVLYSKACSIFVCWQSVCLGVDWWLAGHNGTNSSEWKG